MRSQTTLLASLVLVFLCATGCFCATISLRSRTLDTSAYSTVPSEAHLRGLSDGFGSDTVHQFLVVVSGPLTLEQQQRLSSLVSVQYYMPDDAYLVLAPADTAASLPNTLDFVVQVVPYDPSLRIDPAIAVELATQTDFAPNGDQDDSEMVGQDLSQIGPESFILSLVSTDDAAVPNASEWTAQLLAAGLNGEVTVESAHVAELAVPRGNATNKAAVLQWAAQQPSVHFVEAKLPLGLANHWAQWVTQSDRSEQRPMWSNGLQGNGQVVGIADTGIDPHNCLFSDSAVAFPYGTINKNHRKVIAYYKYSSTDYADQANGHGTHVAGSVAGNAVGSTSVGYYNGMAPSAKLAFFDIGTSGGGLTVPTDLATYLFPQLKAADARIASNSWGCDADNPTQCNIYSSQAASIDRYMAANPDFLVVFAAGNAGAKSPSTSGYSTIGSPATAKNCLTVGATLPAADSARTIGGGNTRTSNETCVTSFSSRGPAVGGRIKPDVMTPGSRIVSARSNGPSDNSPNCAATFGASNSALLIMSGTSMATPIAAGTAALVRQYFVDGFYPSGSRTSANSMSPSAALVKAIMVHSAEPMTGTVPITSSSGVSTVPLMSLTPQNRYYVSGFGRVNLANALPFADGSNGVFGLYVDDASSVSQGQSKTYTKTVGKGSEVRVTLVWTDPASSPNSNGQIVNDLDLKVTVGSTLYYGNTMSATRDSANNVERVILPAPSASTTITITVSGTRVNVGSQKFALVITGDFGSSNIGARANPQSIQETASASADDSEDGENSAALPFAELLSLLALLALLLL